MKKSSVLKVLVVIGLSMILIANLVSVVSADDAFSGWTNPTTTTNNTTQAGNTTTAGNTVAGNTVAGNTISTGNAVTTGNTISTGNTANTTISTGNVTTNLNTTNTNNTSVNSLAYTGVENTSVLAVVMVLGVIVAAYSFKKIREYNNI